MKFFDSLMAPLGKDYCMLFYIFGLYALLLVLVSFGAMVYGILMKSSRYIILLYIFPLVYAIIIYYFNRIHYSICISTLRKSI
jgi:hypothetical protein